MINISESTILILNFLKKHPTEQFTKYDIIENLDISMATTSGCVNGLIKKKLINETIETYPPLRKGEKPVQIRYVKITEEGMKFDPVEEERRLARERAENNAAKKAARAAEKAARAKRNAVD